MDLANGPPVIEPARTCFRKGCGKDSDYQVSMLFFSPQASAPARGETDLAVCHDHGETLKLDEVLTDVAWIGILDGFKKAGKVAPTRSLTRLKLLPILKL